MVRPSGLIERGGSEERGLLTARCLMAVRLACDQSVTRQKNAFACVLILF